MEISIVVPTFNNINYLKKFVESIERNSNFNHQLIIHVNEGSDGTLDFLRKKNIKHTYSTKNIGLCDAVNQAAELSNKEYILYSHDDMYFCKNWDLYLKKEVNLQKNNLFYISGTSVSYKDGLIEYNCGNTPSNFDIKKFDEFCLNDNSEDLQGSHWAPHLIHKQIWKKVGGFSREFDPGDGSDPDLCCKLWNVDVRIFKSLSKFKVYHFGSITTRKRNIKKNNGTKIFLLKWGYNPRFFRKYYLRGNMKKYDGPLSKPNFSFRMIYDLLINKLKYIYYRIF
jgi:glycosyltransferase involved in cell wall biosynthesis